MAKQTRAPPSKAFPAKVANKLKRQDLWAKHKKATGGAKRDARLRRRREEDKNPKLREQRQKLNVPLTLERKRKWDDAGSDDEAGLGLSVDVERLKRRKLEEGGPELPVNDDDAKKHDEAPLRDEEPGEDALFDTEQDGDDDNAAGDAVSCDRADDLDSMIDSDAASDQEVEAQKSQKSASSVQAQRPASPPHSVTSTNLSLMPEALAAKFPTLFTTDPPPPPQVLITTSLHSTLHRTARLLTTLFPNSRYVPRSAHRRGHQYSIREIAGFAARRGYTALIVLNELQKRPHGLDIVHLPRGPTFHFSLSNGLEGRQLPDHGRPTNHYPELILNGFRTPLGLLTAHLFRSLWPARPELAGRQVVTLHNQRDWIFLRKHRYVFREKRGSEKGVQGHDGQPMAGVEGLRAGLQELGPRFSLQLRRVDRGIQRASGQEWEWKGRTDKVRTKFQL